MFEEPPENKATYAVRRRPDRTYLSRSFPLGLEWGRYVTKVFDDPSEWIERDDPLSDLVWTEELMPVTRGGRRQLKFQVACRAGQVRQLQIDQVQTVSGRPQLQRILRLDREAARRFLDLVETLKLVPVEGGQPTVRIDDETLRDLSADPDAIGRLYQRAPQRFRDLIRTDASADDVVALAHRRTVVDQFRRLLTEPEAFSQACAVVGGRPEAVWQRFLEHNPWILGISLAGQLLQAWDETKLEQVVAGFSVAGPGKRADALLRTSGRIRSLVFVEIKHHQTKLLGGSEYRPGCWPASSELVGGVTQVQQTVDRAVREIDQRLADTDETGAETGEATWLIRPRSFLIIGDLGELRGGRGVHPDKHQSFELYRRNLYEPEIITFDELLARAEWHVEVAEREELSEPG